jgi:hypothetical protein
MLRRLLEVGLVGAGLLAVPAMAAQAHRTPGCRYTRAPAQRAVRRAERAGPRAIHALVEHAQACFLARARASRTGNVPPSALTLALNDSTDLRTAEDLAATAYSVTSAGTNMSMDGPVVPDPANGGSLPPDVAANLRLRSRPGARRSPTRRRAAARSAPSTASTCRASSRSASASTWTAGATTAW